MGDAGAVEELIRTLRVEPDAFDQGWSHDNLGTVDKSGMIRCLSSSLEVLNCMARNNATHRDNIVKAGGVQSIQTMLQRVGDLKGRAVFGAEFDVTVDACATLDAL